MKRLFFFNLSAYFITASINTFSQHGEDAYVVDPDPLLQQKLEKWQDLKFGLLMHWGPYSQWGVVESWSICAEDEPWCRRKMEDYIEYKKAYENLKTTFNPVNFDTEKWARAAKDAGMRYMVFTTKHHDGFTMFDSKLTDYKITDPGCPFHSNPKADVTKEIFNAFRAQGFWVGPYFSKPDWHSPYYWWPNFATPDRNVNYSIEKYPDRWEKFKEFTHGQIMELASDYGPVDILWLDGGQVQPVTEEQKKRRLNSPNYKFTRIENQDIDMDALVKKVREKQPGVIVVDRAVYGKNQNYLTPENRVPEEFLPYPWESCITSGGGWSWTPNAKYMSPREAIHLLVDIVAKGGNLLLNIAPGPEGQWQQDAYDLLAEIGKWMKVNGEAIYETRAIAPYKESNICLTRKKDGTVFAIYLADENEESLPASFEVKGITPKKGAFITLLGTGSRIGWKNSAEGFVATIPAKLRNDPPARWAWVFRISGVE
ncbi:MAG TPA: alpha-L-fucosidase [Cyclobacteriaceae bacterium]|nr:alpha-L-fucosidase [Cyclobacteriaceae bacterium]